jgi:hypothetical protein
MNSNDRDRQPGAESRFDTPSDHHDLTGMAATGRLPRSDGHLSNIAFLGSYPPRQCGIATFTHDLRRAVSARFPEIRCSAIAVSDRPGTYDYENEVSFELREQQFADYWQAAEFLRFQGCEAVSVQHEFGIYGGKAGGHLLTFLREVRLPIVTTLHTILTEPDDDQRRVFEELVELSSRVVTMTQRGATIPRLRSSRTASRTCPSSTLFSTRTSTTSTAARSC